MSIRTVGRVALVAIAGLVVTGCKYQDVKREPFQPPAGTLAAIYVDKHGNIIGADSVNHGKFERCALPGSKSSLPTCRGLSREGEIRSINTITVMQSKINSYCETFWGLSNEPIQLCIDTNF